MNLLTLELAKLKHRRLNNKQKTFPNVFRKWNIKQFPQRHLYFHAGNTAHCKEKKSFVHQKRHKIRIKRSNEVIRLIQNAMQTLTVFEVT